MNRIAIIDDSDINLTLHAGSHLVCHYCDYHENLRPKCTECREGEMQTVGLGAELLEKDLTRLFPERRISRPRPSASSFSS